MLQIRKRFSSCVEPEHATSWERFRRPCWSFGYLGQHHSLHKRLPQVGQDDSAWLWCTFLYFSCKGIFEVKCFLFVCMFSHGRDMQVCVWDLHEGRRTVAHSLHTGSVGFCQCCLLEADGSKTLLALPAENMEEVTYQNMSYTCLQFMSSSTLLSIMLWSWVEIGGFRKPMDQSQLTKFWQCETFLIKSPCVNADAMLI